MDPLANWNEQLELADHIMEIWDACPDDGEFSEWQLDSLAHDALRLAELMQALHQWMGDGGFFGKGMK